MGALPPHEDADNPDLLPEEEAELEIALRMPGDSPDGQPQQQQVDQNFDNDGVPNAQSVDQSFAPGNLGGWEVNNVTVEHTCDVYMFQYISTRKMKMRTTSTYKCILLDPMVT